MVVGEAPGFNEDKEGRPWVGAAGTEARHLALISRVNPTSMVYWTNMLKCHPPDDANPTQCQIDACRYVLLQELDEIEPEVIIALGRFSTRFFLGEEVTMERVNGIPFKTDWGTVIPIFHPSWGLRNMDDMVKVVYGFSTIRPVLDRLLPPISFSSIRPVEGRYWDPLLNLTHGGKYSLSHTPRSIAIDTEWAEGRPFCTTNTYEAGTALLIHANDSNNLEQLNSWVNSDQCDEVIIHNAAYDLPVLYQMGVEIPTEKLRDSMVAAYLLQSEPQGLKDLAWRIIGAEMGEYTEVVRPYRFKKALTYLNELLEYEWPDPEEVLEWKKGEAHVRKPQNISRLVSNIIRDVAAKDVDPFQRWEKIRKDKGRSDITLIEHNIGRLWDGDLSDAPPEVTLRYACDDSNCTHQIWPYLRDRIIAEGMWDVFMTDMRVMPMVADMMRFGIRVDPAKFEELRGVFDLKLNEVAAIITGITGKTINPDSALQVSELLYGDLGLDEFVDPRMAKGKSTTMTQDAVLSRIEDKHPVVKWIREYRAFSKLKTSYVEKLPRMIDEDGRIRATVRVTRTATGRLSMKDPPLMAIPVRTVEGRRVREGFIPADGCVISCADYSQVELRITASESGDRRMCSIFHRGEDIHSKTASEMFGIPESRLDSMKHRYPAKRVGFGVLNDISAHGLQRELVVGGANEEDWPVDRCQELIDTWFSVYPGVKTYMDNNRNYAAQHGKVVDMWGRIRWVPWAKTKSKWKRERGLRQAGNAPIQSGAAGVMKRAMANLQPLYVYWRRIKKRRTVPLIQIHDDLVSEQDKRSYKEVLKEQKRIMESADGGKMKVPLVVDMKVGGENWGTTKKYNPE